jgi:hypothetical protein
VLSTVVTPQPNKKLSRNKYWWPSDTSKIREGARDVGSKRKCSQKNDILDNIDDAILACHFESILALRDGYAIWL